MQHNHSFSTEKNNSGESDFLTELAGEATQKIRAVESEEATRQTRLTAVHTALQQIAKYLTQFSSHLNKIQPAIPRTYGLDIQLAYDALQWSEGFVDFRKQSLSENALLDHVTLRIRLTNTAPITLKRRWHQLTNLKKELDLIGLRPVTDLDTLLRDFPQQEFFIIAVEPDFQIRMQFQANYDAGVIDLRCNNFVDFGTNSFTLEPEAFTSQLLDELGRFLIGRKTELPEVLDKTRHRLPRIPTR